MTPFTSISPAWLPTSSLLLANALVFAMVMLLFGGLGLASAFDWRVHPAGWIVMLIGVPGIVLGWLQFRAIFCRGSVAAALLGVILLVIGGGLVWGGMSQPNPPMALMGGWFVVTGLGGFYRRRELLNGRQPLDAGDGDRLPTVTTDRPTNLVSQFARSSWGRHLAPLTVALTGAAFEYQEIPLDRVSHVSPSKAHLRLPPGASDVSMLRTWERGLPERYNFAIDEAGFFGWAAAELHGAEVQPIEKPIVVRRFAGEDGDAIEHSIRRGWYHMHLKNDGEDDSIDVAYDADAGRAFFDSGPTE